MPSAEAKAASRTSTKASLSIFAISVGISLFTASYEKAVEPLFGSVATNKYINYVVHGITALGIILPRPPRAQLLLALVLLLHVAPHTSYWISVFAARNGDPIFGPLVVHATVLAPVIYVAVSLAMSVDPMLATMALAANALQLRPLILFVAQLLSLDTRKDVVFFTLANLMLVFWTSSRIKTLPGRTLASNAIGITKKFWTISIPITLFLFPALRSPTLATSGLLPYENQDQTLRILSSTDSITGVIVVGELLPPNLEDDSTALHSIRYLRASHSILGGVWLGSKVVYMNDVPPRTDQAGTPLGDSIYSTFVLQEAVRLVNSTTQGKSGKWENALVIGLGAGISADAFVRHGISTTVVEIDPAVYDAAKKYFGLELEDDAVFLQDARSWVDQRIASMRSDHGSSSPVFDIVVHDCFSGGAVPQYLFSVEFWESLKEIMSPEGVVAVNLAGKLASKPTRAVITTLLKVFGQCRAFHDLLEPIPQGESHADFFNMVFFCSPSPHPLTFRPSVEGDYLHSYLRRHVLSSLDQREVSLSQIKGSTLPEEMDKQFLLTDMNNTLDEWQHEEALDHWKLMRQILPEVLWETY